MPGVLASHTAFLIGSALEAILYGIYLVLVGYALRILTWRRRTPNVNWPLLFFISGMLLTSTVHYFFGLNALVVGFIKHGDEPGGSAAYLSSKAVGYPMDILLAINLTLSDLTMLHRLYLVSRKNKLVLVIPALILITYIVTLVYGINLMAQGGRDMVATYALIMRLVITSFSFAMVYSICVSGLLAFSIWRDVRQLSAASNHKNADSLRSLIPVFLESGAIIALAQVVNLTVFEIQYRTGHNIWELIGLPLNQIYCIAPTLIIVRVGLGVSASERLATAITRPSESPDCQRASGGELGKGGLETTAYDHEVRSGDCMSEKM